MGWLRWLGGSSCGDPLRYRCSLVVQGRPEAHSKLWAPGCRSLRAHWVDCHGGCRHRSWGIAAALLLPQWLAASREALFIGGVCLLCSPSQVLQIDGNPAFHLLACFENKFVCRPREQTCFIGPHAPRLYRNDCHIPGQDSIACGQGWKRGRNPDEKALHPRGALFFVRSMEALCFRAPPHFT